MSSTYTLRYVFGKDNWIQFENVVKVETQEARNSTYEKITCKDDPNTYHVNIDNVCFQVTIPEN